MAPRITSLRDHECAARACLCCVSDSRCVTSVQFNTICVQHLLRFSKGGGVGERSGSTFHSLRIQDTRAMHILTFVENALSRKPRVNTMQNAHAVDALFVGEFVSGRTFCRSHQTHRGRCVILGDSQTCLRAPSLYPGHLCMAPRQAKEHTYMCVGQQVAVVTSQARKRPHTKSLSWGMKRLHRKKSFLPTARNDPPPSSASRTCATHEADACWRDLGISAWLREVSSSLFLNK